MSELNDKLQEIKYQKDTYILPENLKKDVTAFGITGTLESGVKLFDTEEHMQQDTTAQEGDLAVVYNNTFTGVQADTIFNIVKFPKNVILNEAYTEGEKYCSFRSIIRDEFSDLSASISSTEARFRFYSNTLSFDVTYVSVDGITYVCDNEEVYSLGSDLKCEYDYNDIFSNFILCGSYNFGGIYRNEYYTDKNQIRFMPMSNLKYDIENDSITNFRFEGNMTDVYDYSKIRTIINNMSNDGNYRSGIIFLDSNNNICVLVEYNDDGIVGIGASNHVCYNNVTKKYYFSVTSNTEIPSSYYYKIFILNLENLTYTLKQTINSFAFEEFDYSVTSPDKDFKNWYIDLDFTTYPINTDYDYNEYKPYLDRIVFNYKYNEAYHSVYKYENYDIPFDIYISYYKYLPAPTQFTATSDYVYNKQFLGKDGAGIGTLGVSKSLRKTQFQDIITLWNKLLDVNLDTTYDNEAWLFQDNTDIITIPKLDTSNWTSLYGVFYGCTNLKTVPLLDTSNMTDIYGAFRGCTNLESVPLFDFSKATRCDNVFNGCTKLTEVPNFNFSSATQVDNMFANCTNLVTVPEFNSPNVSGGDMNNIFGNCPNLSDESLNNILAWCTSFGNVHSSSKTLRNVGLSQEQATKCTTLSNWSACQNAGWTTGY